MNPKKIILDTDLGGDCDDSGAFAVLLNLKKLGLADILCVTHCIANHYGAYCLDIIKHWFNDDDIPLGYYTYDNKMSEAIYERFTRPVAEMYFKDGKFPIYENSVELLRKTLSNNGEKKDITLVAIGPLMNISLLLQSKSDNISPKTGIELVSENVEKIVLMAGNFEDTNMHEWNIIMDITAAQNTVNLSPVPIYFSGFELGDKVLVGKSLEYMPEDYPVRQLYYYFNEKKQFHRCSWDLEAVYFAVMGTDDLWTLEEGYDIKVDDNGSTIYEKGGKHGFLKIKASFEAVGDKIEQYIVP
ncbi:MAG: Inosine/uridine-preferring nucleoside hydrolase [Clostridia bacterium]|jgi:inosine-uridine nucleoside N-ribohydrolase|nr:Inosine/uridine-preferring nucleoside hydrolase [Clostridia bacterium]